MSNGFKKELRQLYLRCRKLVLRPLVSPSEKVKSLPEDVNNILVFTMDRLGDLMCSLPVFEILRKKYPDARIHVCSPPYLEELIKGNPHIDEWIDDGGSSFALGKRLSLVGFDLSIDLSCDYPMRKAFLSYFSNSAFRVGYDLYGRGLFFDCPLPFPVQKIHTIDKVLNLLTAFGIEISGCRPELLVQENWKEELEQILIEPETGRKQRIAIHPGGTYQTQRWSEERFAEIGDRIHKVFGFPPLLLGGRGDKQRARTICEKMVSKPIDLTGKLSLGAMAAAISSSRLLICNNSGPLHMAVATGTSTVSVMGPTVPEAWWPRGEIHRVIRKRIACSPCNEGFCHVGTHECLSSISVEEMWREVILQMEQG